MVLNQIWNSNYNYLYSKPILKGASKLSLPRAAHTSSATTQLHISHIISKFKVEPLLLQVSTVPSKMASLVEKATQIENIRLFRSGLRIQPNLYYPLDKNSTIMV